MVLKFLSVIVLLVFASGCGLRAQTYVMTKPRVGIEKGQGNAGYLSGTPVYVEPERKTRRVYVLELTKPIPEKEVKKIEQEIASAPKVNPAISVTTPSSAPAAPSVDHPNRIVIPPIEDTSTAPSSSAVLELTGPKEAVTYTVQKDDTLQKIAKKYYGSYGAWLKIYNANKEKIKNPNLLKSGTVITIPAAK